jgi:hypothetical protein
LNNVGDESIFANGAHQDLNSDAAIPPKSGRKEWPHMTDPVSPLYEQSCVKGLIVNHAAPFEVTVVIGTVERFPDLFTEM